MANQRRIWSNEQQNTPETYDSKDESPSPRGNQIKSFRDLEVYCETVLLSAEVLRQLVPLAEKLKFPKRSRFMQLALAIPGLIADGYGIRFYDKARGFEKINTAIQYSNRMICYCDLMREAYANSDKERALCDEMLEKYFFSRLKLQNLQKMWAKWSEFQPRARVQVPVKKPGYPVPAPRPVVNPRRSDRDGRSS